jgi:hypothetical protein
MARRAAGAPTEAAALPLRRIVAEQRPDRELDLVTRLGAHQLTALGAVLRSIAWPCVVNALVRPARRAARPRSRRETQL